MPAPLLTCMAFVSAFYHLPAGVLPSIRVVEGGRPGLVSENRNGSADLGIMQINTLWVAPLARHSGQSEATIRHRLTHDACFNIAAAGAILRIYLNEEKGNLLRAIGNYHSHTPVLNQAYQERVLSAARQLARPSGGRLGGRSPQR